MFFLYYCIFNFFTAPKVNRKLSEINWNKLSAKQVYDLHRAISHKYALSTSWFDQPCKLYNIELDFVSRLDKKSSSVLSTSHKSALNFLNNTDQSNNNTFNINDQNILPGKITYSRYKKILKIQCADGNWIKCNNFQVSNSRTMSVTDFYNGFLSKKDENDWVFK